MGRTKALLDYRGATFLETIVNVLAPHCSPIIVVLGAHADEIQKRVGDLATFVTNKDYLRGQITSMQCGLRAVPPSSQSVLFTLVDHPALSPRVLEALLRMPSDSAALLRIPRFEGRRGHPIWFSRELISEFLALPETATARDIVLLHSDETQYVDVDDKGILSDIDDPAAYRALIGGDQ